MEEVDINRSVLEKNDQIAEENRQLFKEKKVLVANFIASPGAGKTTLILKTLEELGNSVKAGVIEGDIATKIDAERIKQMGLPVTQINTGGICHLDASMVKKALNHFDLSEIDFLIVENVGNLVCPADFSTGENLKVVILSVPEGDDKPQKYPLTFHQADAVIINKIDLLALSDFNLELACQSIRALNKEVSIFPVSCKTGEGMESWLKWLKKKIAEVKDNG